MSQKGRGIFLGSAIGLPGKGIFIGKPGLLVFGRGSNINGAGLVLESDNTVGIVLESDPTIGLTTEQVAPLS